MMTGGAAVRAGLISAGYLAEQRRLHELGGYGCSGAAWAKLVVKIVNRTGARSILDYGCGSGTFAEMMGLLGCNCPIAEYDPAVPGKDDPPSPADLVICNDVLEHVEPECIDKVLDHLTSLARQSLLVVAAQRLAGRTLSDGRNAHILLRNDQWWRLRFMMRGFKIETEMRKNIPNPGEWKALMHRE